MTSRQNVAILYGFGEGEWHGRKFLAALQAANFAIADDLSQADIIIAHSGGMYALPETISDKTVFLIAPSCGQSDKTWLQTQSKKVWLDMLFFFNAGMYGRWLQKSCWNMFYLVKQIPRLPRLWRIHHRHQAGLPVITAKSTIVAVFKDDPWSGYISASTRGKYANYTFMTIDATHDDIWLHPEVYVELICNNSLE